MSISRISGLASGMDIDAMVSNMMKAQRARLDKVQQSKTLIEWRQESYNDFNKLLANFILDSKKDLGLTKITSTGTMINSSVSSLDWVKSAVVSDSTVADVKAGANAVQGSYSVTVRQLAENWSAASSGKISAGSAANLATQFGFHDTDTLNFTITGSSGSVTVNKTNLTNVSITDIVKEINAANIGVTASYDEGSDRFFLQAKNSGEAGTVSITDNSVLNGGNKFLTGAESALKLKYLDEGHVAQDVTEAQVYTGKDAIIDFGAAVGIKQSSNTFTINDISFTLKETGAATVNVATNTAAIYEKINNFVTKYNELMDQLNTQLSEKRYRNFEPLTDAQREEMSDKQIEQWETKAKSGLLKGDTTIERTLQKARLGMYEKVSGVAGIFDQLTEIGIYTESYSSGSRGGKLEINPSKLAEAIEKDANGVLELLFKEPSSGLQNKSESSMTGAELQQKRSESGLVSRLYDNLISGMKEVINKAGVGDNSTLYRNVSSTILIDFVVDYGSISMLEKDADKLDDKINTLNDYLARAEERYYKQFTAMEEAINKMNQQSAWLSQQFFTTSS